MANNHTTSNTFTTEKNDPSSSAPIWTVPADSASISNKEVLLSNANTTLPTYDALIAPSAPEIGNEPPGYFDISIVPNTAILHYNEVTPYTETSKAEIERDRKGVLSFDPLIDKNPDQLWLYFMTYLNEKPRLVVNICGSYTETYWTTESYTDANGNQQTRDVQQSRDVTEFNFSVDLSPYICEQWWRIAVMPSTEAARVGEIVSLRDALEQYTLSNKKIKKIVLQKQLHGWILEGLRSKLTELVRSTGYGNSISITYSTLNHQIAAHSSSKLNRFAKSTVVRVLCCISCLCIIFGPIYYCLHASGSTRDKIIAEYQMMRSSDTFLQLNAPMIANAVVTRSCESYIAYFA